MRINVYAQELWPDKEAQIVSKLGTNSDGATQTFHGIRMFLKSPEALHDTIYDDDTTAITFWLPTDQDSILGLRETFDRMAALVDEYVTP